MQTYEVAYVGRLSIPEGGLACSLGGFFFYRLSNGDSPRCYLGDTAERPGILVQLRDEIGELVLSEDETFGMLVGGEFAYSGLKCTAEGHLHRDGSRALSLTSIVKITLEKDGLFQTFRVVR